MVAYCNIYLKLIKIVIKSKVAEVGRCIFSQYKKFTLSTKSFSFSISIS